jgi:hypothetical protein
MVRMVEIKSMKKSDKVLLCRREDGREEELSE